MKTNRLSHLFTVLALSSLLAPASDASSGRKPAQNTGEVATYYRFWRGFRKEGIDLKSALPPFMGHTLRVYEGKGLNQYLVGLPPAQKPAGIPDEIALVAFESEAAYRTVRETPEGQAYGDAHWGLFDRATSKSAAFKTLPNAETPLEFDVAYDVIGRPLDWRAGYTTVYIGLRKPGVSAETFASRMSQHVRLVAEAFGERGTKSLNGYLVLITPEYEIAYMNATSQEAVEAALKTEGGQQVLADADQILVQHQWTSGTNFDGTTVTDDRLYKALPR